MKELVLAAGLIALGFFAGHKYTKHEWDKEKLDFQSQVLELKQRHETHVASLQERHKQIMKEVSDAHQKELGNILADYNRIRTIGLRVPRSVCAGESQAGGKPATNTDGTVGRDETAAEGVLLPQEFSDAILRLAREADEVTAQARACQKWIGDNGFYGR